MADKDKASLYVDIQSLFKILYEAQFEIPKRDRIALTNRMLDHTEKILGHFTLAYMTEKKLESIDMMIAEFAALKAECRFAIDSIFRVESTKMKIREVIAKIDESVERWRTYVKGSRQESRPCDEPVRF